MALIATVLDLTKWSSAVAVDPTNLWRSMIQKTFGFWPLQDLPLWALSAIYLIIMFAGAIWMYRSNVSSVAKRQLEALKSGTVTEEYPPSFAEVVVGGAAGVGLFWGLPILKAWTTYGVVLGPVGWAFIAVVGGIAAIIGLSRSAERRTEQMQRIAETNIAYFATQETKRFQWAVGLALLFVLLNFAVAMIR
jgi:hypothetical protein